MSGETGVDEHELSGLRGATCRRAGPRAETFDEEHLCEERDIALDRVSSQSQIARHILDPERRGGASGEQSDQAAKFVSALDHGELRHVSIDEIVHVRLEELRASAVRTRHRLREAPTEGTFEVVVSIELPTRRKPRFVIEDRIDEPVRLAVQLTLCEWPQLDRFGAANKRVRQGAKAEYPR